jgi:SAM-dependent methyltransferase
MPSKPSPAEVDAALYAVQDLIRNARDHWDFVTHRNRYRQDALRIGDHYQDGTIVEIGAFPYHLTMLLKRLGYACTAVDLAPERQRERVEREGLVVHRCDIEREPLPFANASCGLVVFNEVLEHLRVDPLFVMSEISRVMRPGGTLLLTTPNLYAIQRIVKFLLGRGFNDPLKEFFKLRGIGHMGHIREYSAAEVKRFLDYAGFSVRSLSFEHYYYPPTKRGLAARVLFAVLPRRFRSFQVVVADKTGPGPGLSPLS